LVGLIEGDRGLVLVVEGHGQRLGALAVLVFSVVPDLLDGGLGLLGRVAVGQRGDGAVLGGVGQAVALGHVALGPAVLDLCALSIVLGQAGDRGGPLVGLIEGDRGLVLVVEGHGQGLGALAVLVFSVVPDLLDGGLGLLVSVGDGRVGNQLVFIPRGVAAFVGHAFNG